MRVFKLIIIIFIINFVLINAPLQAAETLSLSIAPPIFELKIQPGETWSSSVKIINTNPYDLTVYASVLNFEANGEEGQGKFIPVLEKENNQQSLAQWIRVNNEAIPIGPEKSIELPFTINVPTDAPPGGHYAAILIGTRPIRNDPNGPTITVASIVSSLLFVQIGGEVIENGGIREFSTEKTFYQKPDVNFTLRFTNTGNVHVQPQGDIIIYDLWGNVRGKIPINQERNFGNVLPGTTRKFNFTWKNEENILATGRYTAVVTLSFGNTTRQNTSRTTSFWILPLKPILGTLGILTILFLLIFWGIRRYVRKMLVATKMNYPDSHTYINEISEQNLIPPVDVKPVVLKVKPKQKRSRKIKVKKTLHENL